MTQILLEIPRRQDLEILLALFKRLNIKVIQGPVETPAPNPEAEDIALILAGLPARKDFNAYLSAFEDSRKDKPMLSREN
jgi:hypothetical protein